MTSVNGRIQNSEHFLHKKNKKTGKIVIIHFFSTLKNNQRLAATKELHFKNKWLNLKDSELCSISLDLFLFSTSALGVSLKN